MYRSIIFLLVLSLLFSCQEEESTLTPYLVNTYQELLDSLTLDCPASTSDQFFEATIAGQQTCYHAGVNGEILRFGITTKFTTASPSVTTGEIPTNARRSAGLSIRNSPHVHGKDFIEFSFPDFPISKDSIDYLDSIFAIEYHKVQSIFQEVHLFKVELKMMDMITETGGICFPISTRFGLQEDSFLRFRKVEKSILNGVTSYDIEMEVECNLYHWPQNGKEGLWGRIEDGLFVGTLVVD